MQTAVVGSARLPTASMTMYGNSMFLAGMARKRASKMLLSGFRTCSVTCWPALPRNTPKSNARNTKSVQFVPRPRVH
eukprot:781688-Rhodomonas_salina.1